MRYEELRKAGKEAGDKNFCTVIAWAIINDLTFDESQLEVGAWAYRRFRKGVHLRHYLDKMLRFKDKRAVDVTAAFRNRGIKTIRTLKKNGPWSGTYLVFVKGHVLVFKDGEVDDWSKDGMRRVNHVLKIIED